VGESRDSSGHYQADAAYLAASKWLSDSALGPAGGHRASIVVRCHVDPGTPLAGGRAKYPVAPTGCQASPRSSAP